jgi:hypothetical protein
MATLLNSAEEIRLLEASAVTGPVLNGVRPLTVEFDGCAREWARRFRTLGAALRQQGYSGFKNVTIGRPMDYSAVAVLHLACSIRTPDENAPEFLELVDLLGNYLGEGAPERSLFQEALRNVLRRIRAYQF